MKKMKKNLHDILLIIVLCVFVFSGWKVFSYYRESSISQNLTEELVQDAVQIVVPQTKPPAQTRDETAETEETTPPTEETVSLDTAPVQISFDRLWETNGDIVAWIYCPDTPINHPIVQTGNNTDYLRHLLNGEYNRSGTIFMDYRNQADLSDWNTVVYGHNMDDDTMFGSLEDFGNQDYYEAHPVMYLLTPERDYRVRLIAGYTTDTGSDAYIFPMTRVEKEIFAEESMENSDFTAQAELEENQKLLTLSTCSYRFSNARYVLIGILEELDRPAR